MFRGFEMGKFHLKPLGHQEIHNNEEQKDIKTSILMDTVNTNKQQKKEKGHE
jgi:hypothetical protein